MTPIEPLDQVRKGHIRQVLEHAHGDLAEACRILGVSADELSALLAIHDVPRSPAAAPSHPNPDQE
jgi:DNA-binding NtrC family response regulator